MSKSITQLKTLSPELRMAMLNTVNSVHMLAECIDDRDAATAFIAEINLPLKQLQHKFDMPCGKVVKLRAA